MPVPPPPPPPLPPPPPPLAAPPPPPPAAPPVSTDASSLRKADPKGRSALLADIQQGTRLRKVTQINDRSAPQIEGSKGTNKEGGGGPVNARGGSTPPALGDLFAGGFPVLRPAGQRDAAGGKTGQGPGSRAPSPRLPTKNLGGPLNAPASPRLGSAAEAPGTARTVPPRPSMPAPPPPPPLPPSSPIKTPPVPPAGPPTKGNPPPAAPPPPPPTPPPLPRPQLAPLHLPPIPPPLPLLPPCGYPGLNAEPASPAQEVREPPAPPPPPPLPPLYASCSPRAPAPPLPGTANSGDTPPPLPPKSPSFPAPPPPQKASVPPAPALPPGPPGAQPLLQKKRMGRGPGTGGGKLNPPPAPPARSPTTELSSKSQQALAWTPAQQPGGQLRNGGLRLSDDFESKFTFHSVEDFPPPDEYKPCQKVYPSKVPRSRTPGPWLPAEAAGHSSEDIKGRNSQLFLKTLR